MPQSSGLEEREKEGLGGHTYNRYLLCKDILYMLYVYVYIYDYVL